MPTGNMPTGKGRIIRGTPRGPVVSVRLTNKANTIKTGNGP